MRDTQRLFAAAVWGTFVIAGCVGGSKGLSSEDKDRLKPYVLDAVPEDIPHKVDINFENKAHLVGYKFEPETARPGQDVKLTYWWRCDDTVDDGWMLFTHTKDETSGKLGNLDNDGPIREAKGNGHQVLGPDRWERNKVYVDVQSYKVPDDIQGDVGIYVGIWKGDTRLHIISGPNDGDNSGIVGRIKTGVVAKTEEHTQNDVPSLIVNELGKPAKIVLDGKADEPEWGGAASTGPFVDVGTGKPNTSFPVQASAKVLWDEKLLYVFFEVTQAGFFTGFTDAKSQPQAFTAAGQPKLWDQDTVEMMVDPDPSGDSKDYYELQINPQNKIFKSQFDERQQPSGGPNGPFGHEDWDPKLKSAVLVRKGPDGKPVGYNVEVEIPWAAYAKAANHPPKSGDVWRINFYAMHQNGGVAYSPILGQGNFHFSPRFAKVMWSVPGAAAPTGSAVGAVGPGATGDGGPFLGRPRFAMPLGHPMHPMMPPGQPPPPEGPPK